MIKKITVDGSLTFTFKSSGMVQRTDGRIRQNKQYRGLPQNEIEKNHDEEIRASGFDKKSSLPYKWLNNTFGTEPIMNHLKSIVTSFGQILDIRYNRDDYRKKIQAYYWLDMHFQQINDYLRSHTVQITLENGNSFNLLPFFDPPNFGQQRTQTYQTAENPITTLDDSWNTIYEDFPSIPDLSYIDFDQFDNKDPNSMFDD